MPRLRRFHLLLDAFAHAPRVAVDVVETLQTLREVERARWHEGPEPLLARLRAKGLARGPRSEPDRLRLLRVIRRLDRLMTGGPNCYREALARVALDASSAREPFVLGLNRSRNHDDEPGHAWIDGANERAPAFDVEFRL